MSTPSPSKRLLEGYLSIGATPGESETRRGGRRVFLLALIIATLLSIPPAIASFPAGYTCVGVVDIVTTILPVFLLAVIAIRPTTYVVGGHAMLLVALAGPLIDTAMFGGLFPSGLVAVFGLDIALGALLAIGVWAGVGWFG